MLTVINVLYVLIGDAYKNVVGRWFNNLLRYQRGKVTLKPLRIVVDLRVWREEVWGRGTVAGSGDRDTQSETEGMEIIDEIFVLTKLTNQ